MVSTTQLHEESSWSLKFNEILGDLVERENFDLILLSLHNYNQICVIIVWKKGLRKEQKRL